MSKDKIVLDHGSFSIKYGYAGYNRPLGSIRSVIIKDGINNYIGANESLVKNFKDMEIKNLIKNGFIKDYDMMEEIWDDIFTKMKVEHKTSSILFTESIGSSTKSKEKIKEIMFEKYNFNAIQFCDQSLLALYGSGRSTGIVLDIGHDLSKCVPIYDSFILDYGVQISNLAGNKFNKFICDKNSMFKYPDEMDKYKKKYFINKSRNLYRDFFVDNSLSYTDNYSMPEMLYRTLKRTEIDLKKDLAQNIVLIGGTSKIPGLCKNICDKLLEITPYNIKYKLTAPLNRQYLSWIGGSILVSMSVLDSNWNYRTN